MGFLPVPQLNYGKENFPEAVRWQTKLKKGCVDIYTGDQMMSPKERMRTIIEEIANNKTKLTYYYKLACLKPGFNLYRFIDSLTSNSIKDG